MPMRSLHKTLTREFDISELIVAGNDRNAVIVIMTIVPMIMTASLMVLRGDCPGCFLNGVFRADSTNMVGPAMQALHVSHAIETT
jgi:hypothetical protein